MTKNNAKDPLSGLRPWAYAVYAGAFAMAAVIGWAASVEIETHVSAPGSVVPWGAVRKIQHLEGGTVRAILVREGAVVKAGDILVQIDPVQAESNAAERAAKIGGLCARAAKLNALADGRETLGGADCPSDALAGEAAAMRDDLAALRAKLAGLDKDIAEAQASITAKQASLAALRVQESTQAEITKGYAPKNGDGSGEAFFKRGDYLSAKERLDSIRAQAAGLPGEIAALESRVGSLTDKKASELAAFRAERRTQAAAAAAELAPLRENRSDADRVRRTDVRSPVDGVVQSMSVHDVGEVVKPSGDVASVVPSTDGLVVEARVSPKDRRGLVVGMPAYVALSAFEISRYGTLDGTLVSISPTTEKNEDMPNAERAFIARIVTKEAAIAGEPVRVGMVTDSVIVTGHRTPLSYLAGPLANFGMKAMRER